MRQVLRSWQGTRWQAGQQLRGVAADCVRFGTGFYDDMFGYRRTEPDRLQQDVALHDRATALAAMRLILRLYAPVRRLAGFVVQPGDALVVGARGPGHLMVVGPDPNTLWHCSSSGVCWTGTVLDRIPVIYRCEERHLWLRSPLRSP